MTDEKVKKGRRTLLILVFVAVTPIVLAYTAFFTGIGVPSNTANKGTLLSPAININALLNRENEALIKTIEEDKKWHLFIPVGKNCNDACQNNLYTTRQVHTRLGEKSIRMDRYAISLAGEESLSFLNDLKTDHPKLNIISVNKLDWDNWLDNSVVDVDIEAQPFYLLVDQEGFAMMHYNADIHGNDLLKDIKRTLKYSIDYQ